MHYYTVDEVKDMLRAAGLDPIATYGSANGDAFKPATSGGMFILAVKR
jgi:hypothetical protein